MSTSLTNAQTTLQNNIDELPKSLLNALYPVGSLYISTTSTCPLQTLGIGTWTKQSATTLVTSVNTNVPIKGDGYGLVLTDGTNTGSLVNRSNDNNFSTSVRVKVGTENSQDYGKTNRIIGVTTDASKSGIVGTVTRSTMAVTIWKRTA